MDSPVTQQEGVGVKDLPDPDANPDDFEIKKMNQGKNIIFFKYSQIFFKTFCKCKGVSIMTFRFLSPNAAILPKNEPQQNLDCVTETTYMQFN